MSEQLPVVWEADLDQRFLVKVTRAAPRDNDIFPDYRGELTVTDNETQKVIFTQEVGLSYGARFGPDVGDVREWQQIVETAVEEYLHGNPLPAAGAGEAAAH